MTADQYSELIAFLAEKFGRIDERFDALEARVTRVEVGLEALRHEVRVLSEGLAMTNQRLDRFESWVHHRFDEFEASVNARFAAVDIRFDGVDARFNEVDARFNEVDARFNEVDARFNEVDARFESLETRLDRYHDDHDGRIRALEAGMAEA